MDATFSGNFSFINNSAYSLNPLDATSGLGGAIFLQAKDSFSLTPTYTFTANNGQTILFRGNTHKNGQPNSIFFGNIYPGDDTFITAIFHVENGGNIHMYDPMASQQDSLQKPAGDTLANLDLAINKIGAGTWALGGVSTLESKTVFDVQAGTLHLMDANSKLNLNSHEDSEFLTQAGSTLRLTLLKNQHSQINTSHAVIADGSKLSLSGLATLVPGQVHTYKGVITSAKTLTDSENFDPLSGALMQASTVKNNLTYDLVVTTQAIPLAFGLDVNVTKPQGFLGSGAYLENHGLALLVDEMYISGNLLDSALVQDINTISGSASAAAHAFGSQIAGIAFANITSHTAKAGQNNGLASGSEPAFSLAGKSRGWVTGSGSWANLQAEGNMPGVKSTVYGLHVGYDLLLHENVQAGLTLGYGNATINPKKGLGTRTRAESVSGGLYALATYNNFGLNIAALYGNTSSKSTSQYSLGSTSGKYNTNFFAVNLGLDYTYFSTNGTSVKPFVGLEYYTGRQQAHTETGSDVYARAFKATTYSSVRTPVGVEIAHAFAFNNLVLTPSLSLAYAHNFGDKAATINARFANGSTWWQTTGINPGRDSFLLNAALNAAIGKNIEVGLDYGLDLRKKYTEHKANFVVKIAF